MKYKVSYLPIADRDIQQIGDALSDYPNKAKRLFREIERKVKNLENMPSFTRQGLKEYKAWEMPILESGCHL